MARYRKIDTRMWADAKFRTLSSPPPSGKYLWIALLTGPYTTNLPGLFRVGEMALAEELGWTLEGFREGFAELFREGLAKADWNARVVWIPNAIKYNPPDNPNVVKGWRDSWDEVPECALKAEAYQTLRTFTKGLGEGFGKAFAEGCVQCLANQEQEQEQLNTLPQTTFADDECEASSTKNSKPSEAQVEQLYDLYPRKREKLDAKKAIRKAVAVVMAGDADHPAMSVDGALDYVAQRVTLYAQCVQGCDRNFIPYPASWFNAGSFWDDERDWSSWSKGPKNMTTVTLPDTYVSASDKIRQERSAGGMQ